MKRTTAILLITVISVFLVDHAFGQPTAGDRAKRAAPVRRVDRVAPKRPGRAVLRKIPTSTTINVVKTGHFNVEDKPFRMTACTLNDGNIFIGWEAFADKAGQPIKWRAGRGAKYNTQFRRLGVDMIYTATRNSYFLEGNSSVPFANGNVLLAFNDKVDGRTGNGRGRFVLLNSEMNVLAGPVTFCQSDAKSVSATSMLDGDAALIAYGDTTSDEYQGKFLIVDSSGNIITQPKPYTYKGEVTEVTAGTTWNGKAFIAYNCGGEGSLSIEANVLGNLSRNIRPIWNHKTMTQLAVCPLSNKNTLVLGNWENSGQALPIGPDGKYTGGFQQFHPQQVFDVQATLLSNDNILVSFTTQDEKAMCVVLDSTGKLLKGPKPLCEGYNVQPGLDTLAQTKLHNDMVVVITYGYRKAPHNDAVATWTVLK
jgi:hypothetical protein